VTLKLVARFADACNINADPDTVRYKLGVLRNHCLEAGRDESEIIKSSTVWVHLIDAMDDPERATEVNRRVMGNTAFEQYADRYVVGTVDDVEERVTRLAEAGIEYILIYLARAAYQPELIPELGRELTRRFS
jgi:alkanesulfonate monooxygenase SsuD/methylene tetrahydromethanopterin reductase-like flavin-dependent oxidoreductase (luciferase family)